MTAAYSEDRPDKAAPFHLSSTGSADGQVDERNAWESIDSQARHSAYLDARRTAFEAAGGLPPVQQSVPALETIDWTGIDEEVRVAKPIEFFHVCEEEFARMLDARDISWRYKPRTFAVEWDEEGNFVDCFTPDFYLTANEMYIALMAPDRNVSNTKIRHVKMLRRQHPEIRIELFHGAHGRHLVETVS